MSLRTFQNDQTIVSPVSFLGSEGGRDRPERAPCCLATGSRLGACLPHSPGIKPYLSPAWLHRLLALSGFPSRQALGAKERQASRDPEGRRLQLTAASKTGCELAEWLGLPLWLSPTQVTVIPVVADFADYAAEVTKKLADAGVRVELDDRNEKLGYRIREAQLSKVPYMLVVGEDEMKTGTVTARARVEGEGGKFSVDDFVNKVLLEIRTKKH